MSGSTGRMALDRVFTPPETHQPVLRIERQDHREEFVLPPDHQFANVVRAVRDGADIRPQQDGTVAQAHLMARIDAAARRILV